MGIPAYFSFLRRRYGRRLDEWLLPSLPVDQPCTHLYVDLNGIIHIAAYKTIQRFEDEYLARQQPNANSLGAVEAYIETRREMLLREQLHPRLFQEVVEAIQRLLDVVRPTALCYLAIDGVAPRAKMVQQRQRRYRAVEDKVLEHALYHKHHKSYVRGLLWDSNCVTPGTTFMKELETYMHVNLHKDLVLPHATTHIVLSDATEPGEGEHKIMDHMRCSSPDKGTTVIYGQDADLLMLAFAYRSYNPDIRVLLLREKDVIPTKKPVLNGSAAGEEVLTRLYTQEISSKGKTDKDSKKCVTVATNNSLQYVHIAELEKLIIQHMERYGDLYVVEDYPRVMRDYVALCFLLGNDFLPHGPSLAIPADGIDTLFETYVPLRKSLQRFLTYEYKVNAEEGEEITIPPQTHFDHSFLTTLVEQFAHQEDYLSTKVFERILQKRKWALQQQRYPNEHRNTSSQQHLHYSERVHSFEHDARFLQSLPPGEWASDDIVAPGTIGWQRRYYMEVEKVRNMEDVHGMCKTYLQGMYWTLQYYCHGCWSTAWQYPYVSAPLLSNLTSYLARSQCNVNRLVKRHPKAFCKALEQLRTVLPPTSFARCVEDGGECQTGICGELVAFSKRYRWECPVRVVTC